MDFSSNLNSDKRSAKIYFSDQDIRRINFNSTTTFSQFRELVKKIAGTTSNEFRIRYHDDENDLITVETEEEWLEALSITPASKPIRISVEFKKPQQQQNQQEQQNPLMDIINQFQNLFVNNNNNTENNNNNTQQRSCSGCPYKQHGQNKHFGVICDGCDQENISERYKCDQCDNFDYCGTCYAKRDELKHDPNHTFTLIPLQHRFRRGGCRGFRGPCGWQRHFMNSQDINFGVTCDGCGEKHFRGQRYKCDQCPDFDFCEKCYPKRDELKHDPSHTFSAVEKMRFGHGHCPYFQQVHQQQQQEASSSSPVSSTSTSSSPSVPVEPVIQQQDQPKQVEEKPIDESEFEVVYTEPAPKQQQENKVAEQQPVPPQQQQTPQQRFGNWWTQFLTQPAQQQQQQPAPFAYEAQLKTMQEMGFIDTERCIRLLNKWKGNVDRAINEIVFDGNN